MENGGYLTFVISFVLSISSIIMFAACLCCRKKVRSNELLGLEGMVKIKNPDENLQNGNHTISIDPNPKASSNDIDAKRASTAPHRSLPDIPVSDPNQLDTNSDLYATVGDKVGEKPQGRSPTANNKKQISVSQHSSISQADDCSSPYARVRSPSHAYDKVRPAEHPYAQVKGTDGNGNRSTITASTSNAITETNGANGETLSRRGSQQSLLDSIDGRQPVIPAASAIAGRVSASQELPYMTPPIVQSQQFFSGDSQDSSKGYTSISVREPLANIIAQTKKQNAQVRRREMTDSHYATVSDDSDEMYAAIEDPNNQVDLYTSGSETYAQIQPQETVVVSVEINTLPTISSNILPPVQSPVAPIAVNHVSFGNQPHVPSSISSPRHSIVNDETSVNPTPVDILKAAHSRQASSSSCTSSVGNLGSPKPEKRQANSPLPPTPKTPHHHHQSTSSLIQSGRNSAASVIEVNAGVTAAPNNRQVSRENLSSSMDASNRGVLRSNDKNDAVDGDEPRKNRLSKDLEGMYAKVMKKNKLSSAPSQSTSPVPNRKTLPSDAQPIMDRRSVFLSDPDIAHEIALADSKSVHASPNKNGTTSIPIVEDNNYETIDKRRTRSSNANYGDSKDPGYETIPADKPNNASKRNNLSRVSAPPGIFVQKIADQPAFAPITNYGADSSEPGYESLPDQSLLSNDPGYETVEPSTSAKISSQKPNSDYDPNYEELRPAHVDNISDHYAKVWGKSSKSDANDGYSSIKPIKKKIVQNNDDDDDEDNPDYCTISNPNEPSAMTNNTNHDYACIAGIRNDDESVYSSITSAEKASNNLMVTSTCSTISDSKTLTSPSSESGSGADGTSSTDTPIRYNSIRSNTEMTISVSNYESLTGSESDSNYESVRYLNAKDRENPYERLHNENDLKYDTLKRDVAGLHSSPRSNSSSNFNNNNGTNSKSNSSCSSTSKSDGKISSSSSTNLNSNSEASDMFQV